MPVLMADVAKLAGVSVTTVSHVINSTRDIAPKTRERVMKAVRELNYYKNNSARLLVRGQSDIVGMVLSDIENPFLPPLIKSFERAATNAGLELLLGMTNYEARKAEASVRRMIESRVRGVAVMTSQIETRLVEALLLAEVAVVALDWPRIAKGVSSLTLDYSTGITEALEHLYRGGHRHVGIVHGPANIVSAARYNQLLREGIRDFGMTLVGSVESNNQPEGGAEAAETLLRAKLTPSALLCGNDLMAIGAMGAAMRLGIAVPGDLSIIGSDDIAMASYSNPSLSTVRIPRDAMGYEAFRLLERMYGKPLKRGAETCIATSFIARGSTARSDQERPLALPLPPGAPSAINPTRTRSPAPRARRTSGV